MKKFFIACAVTVMLTGCGKAKLDSTSDATMKASIEKMTKNSTKEQKEKLAQAIVVIGMKIGFDNMNESQENIEKKFHAQINGKTMEEIIAMAEKMAEK